jgi:outer membrane protein OmpA-like peptidoglycan-associated protein
MLTPIGSPDYNMRVSLQRAEAIKTALASERIVPEATSTDARGEAEPLVPTSDGVPEPQNRRIEIASSN